VNVNFLFHCLFYRWCSSIVHFKGNVALNLMSKQTKLISRSGLEFFRATEDDFGLLSSSDSFQLDERTQTWANKILLKAEGNKLSL
jgi:hypothetical protein